MIKKRKGKFTHTLDSIEVELGAKYRLFQDAGNDPKKGADIIKYAGATTSHPVESIWPKVEKTIDEKITDAQNEVKKLREEQPKSMFNLKHGDGYNSSLDAAMESLKLLEAEKQKEIDLQISARKNESAEKMKQIDKNIATDKNWVDVTIARDNNHTNLSIAELTANTKKSTEIAVAKIQQDPNQLSQTEMHLFNILKKYDFLNDPEAFKTLLNTTADGYIRADAYNLELDLKQLGMHLKADGDIDQNTIDAVEAVISKNAPAIKVYKEVTGIDPLRPSKTPDNNLNNAAEKNR